MLSLSKRPRRESSSSSLLELPDSLLLWIGEFLRLREMSLLFTVTSVMFALWRDNVVKRMGTLVIDTGYAMLKMHLGERKRRFQIAAVTWFEVLREMPPSLRFRLVYTSEPSNAKRCSPALQQLRDHFRDFPRAKLWTAAELLAPKCHRSVS